MKAPKQKIQERKTESKVSVRHYLNTNLKGKQDSGKILYPLYIQITNRGKTNYAKSFLKSYVAQDEFETFKANRQQEIQEEIQFITDRINMLGNISEKFTLKNVAEVNEYIYYVISDCLKKEVFHALLSITQPVETIEQDRRLSEISDYKSPLRYIIDWGSPAEEILEALLPIVKLNENLLALKNEFLKEEYFFDLLLNPSLHEGMEITLRDWQVGYAQVRLLRMYRGTHKEQICEDYIGSIDRLLRRHKKIL